MNARRSKLSATEPTKKGRLAVTQFDGRRYEYDQLGNEVKLRVARLTALLYEFELHLCKNEVESARDRLATITTTLAVALTDSQWRAANASA
jgi:hypothetical protein